MNTHVIGVKPVFVKSLNGESYNANRIYSLKPVKSAIDENGNRVNDCYVATIDDGAVFHYYNFLKEEIENKLDIQA